MTRFFCPGRVELAGSYTDLHRGRVMAAAMDRGITAEAEPNDEGVVRISCEGFDPVEVALDRLWPDEKETGTSTALVRGVAGELKDAIPVMRGYDAYLFSDLPPGRGLASSAAFTVLAGFMLAVFSGVRIDPEELARAAQKAGSRWYGKYCGLSEPLICAMGGGVYVDAFENKIRPMDIDFDGLGLALCLTDTGAVPAEDPRLPIAAGMAAVAQTFGEPVLAKIRGPLFDEQYKHHPSDPSWAMARHFFDETWRVASMADAMGLRDGVRYMELMDQSGHSSERLLRELGGNCFPPAMAQGLEATRDALAGRGAWQAHGGGFGGFVQALMPEAHFAFYRDAMDRLFGEGACRRIHISGRGVCLAQEEKQLFARGFPDAAADLLG